MNEFDYSIVRDPEIFAKNRLPAHSDHLCFSDAAERESGISSFRESLNGIWYFHYARNYGETVPGFFRMDYDARRWEEIRVPGHIQLEGYGRPGYVNTQYPWDGREEIDPGMIPEDFNPVGSYVKYFSVPERMRGKRLYLSFQGVESAFSLWLNGSFVGYSEDSFTPSEFELTPFLLPDRENKLSVQVFQWSAGSWLEDQDFFRFSGIFRDVYLFIEPKLHVRDLSITAEPEEDLESASLKVRLLLNEKKGRIRWGLRFLGEEILGGELCLPLDSAEESFGNGSSFLLSFSGRIEEPHLWSAEKPNLYELKLELFDEEGALSELIFEHVGVRRFELKDGLMCLNGRRIVFFGANRHEFSSDRGRAVREEDVRRDLLLMKRNNINAVRTSHYPNASLLYRLCDELGLYLIAENNMESHGVWLMVQKGQKRAEDAIPGDRMEYLPMMLDRVNSCYQRDKNHASILIWSIGNESYGGEIPKRMTDFFHEKDRTRLVHYEGVAHDRRYPDTTDMESQMYIPVAKIEDFLKEHREKPFLLCEYTHSMGNSNGGMQKYTELSDREMRFQGGFIWDFIDQSLRSKNRYGEEFQAYGGDFLERPTDFDFSGNGILDGNRRPYEKMQEVKFCYQGLSIRIDQRERSFWIKNRFLFTDASEFDCLLILEREGRRIREESLSLSLPPLSERKYALPDLPELSAGEYALTLSFRLREDRPYAKRGYEIAFGQTVFRIEKDSALPPAGGAGWREKSSGEAFAAAADPAFGFGLRSRQPFTGDGEESPGEADFCGSFSFPDNYSAAKSGGLGIGRRGLRLIRGSCNIGIRGEHFDLLFSLLKGGLVSYRYAGRELLERLPRPNFWRAPISNDLGNQMPLRCGIWKLAGLYQTARPLETDPHSPGAEDFLRYPILSETEDFIELKWKHYLPGTLGTPLYLSYRVFPDGRVRVILDYPGNVQLPPMPEFGYLLILNADFKRLRYYGLGPGENYCDRRSGARLGIYEREIAQLREPYLVPQESGNRCAVRWAEITDERGRGLRLSGADFRPCVPADPHMAEPGSMELSASNYTPEQLEEALHAHELPRPQFTVLRANLKQMGVGGDDSWGARTHEEYLLPNDRALQFAFDFKGI